MSLDTLRLDERLNLVLPLRSKGGVVHCPPLSREVFRLNWRLFAETWSVLEKDDLSITAAGAVASLAMQDIAEKQGEPEKCRAVLAEIGRMAHVILPSEEGYQPLLLTTARKRGLLDGEELDEVLNALVFFTVSSAIQPRERQMRTFQLLCLCRDVDSTSLSATALADSLPTSTGAGNTGGRADS